MSNHDTRRLQMAQALQAAFHDEVMEQSPSHEEIEQLLLANGENPDAIAAQYKSIVADKIRAAKRERLLGLRQHRVEMETRLTKSVLVRSAKLPTPSVIRSKLRALSETSLLDRSALAIQYRNGTNHSDSDLQSLYEDLLQLGVIEDDTDD